jgi:uncharacterized OB-fold protein
VSAAGRPAPQADEASREFFEGARRRELMLMRCRDCGAWRLPSRPRCPDCWSMETEWARASGRGTLYSFGLMHQKFPGFEDTVPYNYAVVELEEGPRIVTNITGVPDAELRVDMPVVAVFDDVADDATLVRFTRA